MAASLEGRAAYLEGKADEHARGSALVREDVQQLRGRVDALDQRVDHRIDGLDQKVDRFRGAQ